MRQDRERSEREDCRAARHLCRESCQFFLINLETCKGKSANLAVANLRFYRLRMGTQREPAYLQVRLREVPSCRGMIEWKKQVLKRKEWNS